MMPSLFMSPDCEAVLAADAAVEERRRAEVAVAVVQHQGELVVVDVGVDDVPVAVAVDVEHGDAVRLRR